MAAREDGAKKDPAARRLTFEVGDGDLTGGHPVGQDSVDFGGQGSMSTGPGGGSRDHAFFFDAPAPPGGGLDHAFAFDAPPGPGGGGGARRRRPRWDAAPSRAPILASGRERDGARWRARRAVAQPGRCSPGLARRVHPALPVTAVVTPAAVRERPLLRSYPQFFTLLPVDFDSDGDQSCTKKNLTI
ncbi:hypothetical protein SETIT_1G221700v2 [Setaria italica]|uniref:Uncharacterized protein n=1 Tax=Setaria italica TaxID=4555 RepID=A0A368PNT1_SETIT|nr:hypothetical protein SETIT_1G221700v2 [Setaria italica]